ncbi:metal-dependent hydrolase [Cohnella zeiphila]|uniref:UPF0173 metal-dependent hydrolase H7C18_30110 n=1 Tax=Cohnella zeiphila TaxID=2761120 RepID=A0A7X0VYA8_9BACL|nr:metal-dependent hydrolase [Cohnella zeiphila]MBB6735174.1 metal-dependent hydrolase [Cohnella zeiphila]
MDIIFHGQSGVQIVVGDKSLIIDPFLSGNPLATVKPEDVRADYVLLTHAHGDHILDAEPISKANKAPVVSIVELATYMSWKGVDTIGMNLGGTVDLGFAKAKLVPAFHSSGIVDEKNQNILYAGMPAGFIIRAEGKTIFHAGDTCLYGDMKMLGELESFDLALLPIGDHFTMDPDDALIAAEWLRARQVVPIHYNTFPPIRQDADAFARRLEEKGIRGRVLAPGERMTL